MGVQLGPLIVKKIVGLRDLENRILAVDASSILHQFLSLIRYPDGTPLMDRKGNITSSLVGLFYRSSRLIYEYKIPMIFVFDGKRPEIKFSWLSDEERKMRKEKREKIIHEWKEAVERGDFAKAFSKAVTTGKLDKQIISDAKRLLDLMGVPYVQAPSEAEAQAAHMAKVGSAWASNSGDYDSLLFGTPRMARYISIAGKYRNVWLPSKPEVIELQKVLNMHKITYEQLIDLALLIGTDYNRGIKGIGPKKALYLIRSYGSIENMPSKISEQFVGSLSKIREAFLKPSVTDNYQIERGPIDEKGLVEFLCEERDFSKNKVLKTIEKMRKARHQDHPSILKWSLG